MEAPLLRPTVATIDLDALRHNYTQVKNFVAPAKVMAVVKANAYGHGLIECARTLEAAGVDAFGVALVDEGVQLRNAGIKQPILIFGGILGDQIQHFLEFDLGVTASSVGKLLAIEATAKAMGKKANVHLKIDTGMERIGVHHYSAASLFEKIKECPNCEIKSVFSHFVDAEDLDSELADEQLSRFTDCVAYFEEHGLEVPCKHMANSAALLRDKKLHLDMVRPGVCLYGASPLSQEHTPIDLKPVMSVASKVVYFKVVRKGAGVSYRHSWKAPADTRVVTVPIGYGDGLSRHLSNRGEVIIRGKRFPMVGDVCMDQVMINVGQGEAYNGDEVIIIGEQGRESITVTDLAERADSIPHEVFASLDLRIPRRYVGENATS